MNLTISSTRTRVGGIVSFISTMGPVVIEDVKYEITEGKDLVSLKDNVFTALKEGLVSFRAIKEGYKHGYVFFNIFEPFETVEKGYFTNLNENSLSGENVNSSFLDYFDKDVTILLNEGIYTFYSGAFGIVSGEFNNVLTDEYSTLRINKNMKAISTSSNLSINKVVIEQLGFKNEQVTPLIVESGGEIAVPTFGELQSTFKYISNGEYSGEIYRQLVTYTFNKEHIDSSLTITGSKDVTFLNNIYLYGKEAPLKFMYFQNILDNTYVDSKVLLSTSSSDSKFDANKVKFTIVTKETGMGCYIEENVLFTGTKGGFITIIASLDGFATIETTIKIEDKKTFLIGVSSINLIINNKEYNVASFEVDFDAMDVVAKSDDESIVSITNNGSLYSVTALKVGKTNLTISGKNYKDFIIPVNVSYDELYSIDSTEEPKCIVSSPNSENYKNKYKVTGIIRKIPTSTDISMKISTNFGLINISDASLNNKSLQYNNETGLLDFVKDENESLVGNKRLVVGAKITLIVTRKDKTIDNENEEPRSFVGYIESIEDLAPTSITLETTTNNVYEFQDLETSIKVGGATNMNLTYSYTSSNNEVATVDEKGVIHALKVTENPTEVTITATCNEISTLTSSITITVEFDMNLIR